MFHGLTSDFFVDLQVHSVLGVVIQPRCGDFRISFGGISVKMAKYFVKSQVQEESELYCLVCKFIYKCTMCVAFLPQITNKDSQVLFVRGRDGVHKSDFK